MSVTLYYNPDCGDCECKANRTTKLDWFGRVRISTNESPIGRVPRGEIVVVEEATQRVLTGIYATRAICMQVPAFFAYGLMLYVTPFRWLLGRGERVVATAKHASIEWK